MGAAVNEYSMGYYVVTTSFSSNYTMIVDAYGDISASIPSIYGKEIGCRPVIKDLPSNSKILEGGHHLLNGVIMFEYGEYPQSETSENESKELERLFGKQLLNSTGKEYTIPVEVVKSYHWDFHTLVEYEYNGRKFVRLGNVLKYDRVSAVWIEVTPIYWKYDKDIKIAIADEILFSGGPFVINEFLNKRFGKEIVPSNSMTKINSEKSKVKKENPYSFDFSEVTEEDIIKGSIESNVSVFLHGKSSEGKSARVKQLDPDCEIIYMRNVTPDSLNGKSVYNQNTGEMIDIPPTWYTKLKEKCEEEPNKLHLVFFDELTNALPSIQGMAFNIILDGEINGKWKLPENARIVAAGNDLNDSLAANQMAEPLFNRFAHVYINTTVEDWLNWAATPKTKYERLDYIKEGKTFKIHPLIYSYIAYKSSTGTKDVLRTPFTGEAPNADPRKWEMASKVLTKTNKPEMLRALIGDRITKDFVQFAKQEVITLEDVLNDNYTESDLKMCVSEKFAVAAGFSIVDEDNFEKVRNFMKKLGSEFRAAFEAMWARGNKKRLEIIAELRIKDMENVDSEHTESIKQLKK